MNQREKTLAIVTGVAIALFVLYFGYFQVMDGIQRLHNEKKAENKRKEAQDLVMAKGARDRGITNKIRERSLHPNPKVAKSMYRDWIHRLVKKAKFTEPKVTASSERLDKDKLFYLFDVDITGRGNIKQVTEFLYDFYSIDHLHSIRRLYLKPLARTKTVDITVSIRLMSLVDSPARDKPLDLKAERLDHKELKTYVEGLVHRNFFRQANLAPKFASTSVPPATVGRSYSTTVKATDADKDQLHYSIDKAPLDLGMTIDPTSGRVRFQPRKTGEYLVAIRVTDNGLPAKSKVEEFRFRVNDPPPPRKIVKKPEPPKFDTSKLAFLTATIEIEGPTKGKRMQAWVNLRNEDRTIYVHVGDPIRVGLLEGKVLRISRHEMEIKRKDGKVVFVRVGKSLSAATELPGASE